MLWPPLEPRRESATANRHRSAAIKPPPDPPPKPLPPPPRPRLLKRASSKLGPPPLRLPVLRHHLYFFEINTSIITIIMKKAMQNHFRLFSPSFVFAFKTSIRASVPLSRPYVASCFKFGCDDVSDYFSSIPAVNRC
jgi:hypothetical protein